MTCLLVCKGIRLHNSLLLCKYGEVNPFTNKPVIYALSRFANFPLFTNVFHSSFKALNQTLKHSVTSLLFQVFCWLFFPSKSNLCQMRWIKTKFAVRGLWQRLQLECISFERRDGHIVSVLTPRISPAPSSNCIFFGTWWRYRYRRVRYTSK